MPQIRVQTCNSRVVLVLQIATPPRVGPTHTLPFIGYLPAIAAAAATALPLTGPQSQKALQMCPAWCKKVQILLRGRSTKRTLTWIQGYGRHRKQTHTHTEKEMGTQDEALSIASFAQFQFPQLLLCCIKLMKRIPASLCFDPAGHPYPATQYLPAPYLVQLCLLLISLRVLPKRYNAPTYIHYQVTAPVMAIFH